jgi:glucose-6-phosphate 1-epimerase
MNKTNDLNERFGIKDSVIFKESPGELVTIDINTRNASASIALQGAQVLTWAPVNEKPVVWLSPAAKYLANKSLRGGIPICWPWFGPHDTHPEFPAHGVARTAPWQVKSVELLHDGRICLIFSLPQTVDTGAYWPYVTPLQYSVTIGDTLELELLTRNESETDIILGEALHTYFAVSDVRNIRVRGLQGCEYIDKVDQAKRKHQDGEVNITGEVDRVYLNTNAECIIEDSNWKRRIHIEKQGSHSTVIWNPWIEKSDKMGDLGDEGYLNMLCVESANAADNVVTLPSRGEHRLQVKYSTTPYP